MEPFQKVTSIVTPLDKVNVDTDQIIPKQFLKLVQKSGFGKFLFFNWRYDENENLKSDFVLNDSQYNGSKILSSTHNLKSKCLDCLSCSLVVVPFELRAHEPGSSAYHHPEIIHAQVCLARAPTKNMFDLFVYQHLLAVHILLAPPESARV